MRRFLLTAAIFGSAAALGQAQNPFQLRDTKTDGNTDSGWVVQAPAGSSDFFNVRYDLPANTHSWGISISVADFGATAAFPQVACGGANLGLDPSGQTPDLGNVFLSFSNVPGTGALHQTVDLTTPGGITLPGGITHIWCQFPPGDPGLLGISADSNGNTNNGGGGECSGPNPYDSSAFTLDGYSTPGAQFGSGEFHLNGIADPGNTQTRLRLHGNQTHGDYTDYLTGKGLAFGVGVWAPNRAPNATLWLLFLSFLGAPIQPVGPVLPTLPVDADGNGSTDFRAIKATGSWPSGAGNLTLNFVAISGSPGVLGSIQTSNEVTVCSLPDPPPTPWGVVDDGTIESGWVVAIPAGSCDYFSQLFDACPTITLTGRSTAVMDFGTTASSYPNSGFAPPNTGLDPSKLSPDLGNPYLDIPMLFPSLTFCTTSGQYVVETNITNTNVSGLDILGFVRFPPGDPGLLGIGGDTTLPRGKTGWTLDCFSTPANPFGTTANWGMRALGQ